MWITVGGENYAISFDESLVDKWSNIVGVYKSGRFELWLNGVRKALRTDVIGDIDPLTSPINVGRNYPATAGYFGCPDGIIDEVLIFNRALSEEEIKDLYSYYQNSEISNGKITILTNRYSFNLYFIGNPQSSLGSKYIAYITLKNDTVIKKDIDISPCNLGSECISSPTIKIETDSEIKKIEVCSKALMFVQNILLV
jgi:hypothetical protein